jgi:hypothetical protein
MGLVHEAEGDPVRLTLNAGTVGPHCAKNSVLKTRKERIRSRFRFIHRGI